tara:strand:- start:5983 stop:6615 length:633 start_codon:yes stop_codon:yes gene_type:complete
MSITYPLSVPNYTSFQSVSMVAKNTVGISSSPFTQNQKVYKWASGEYWECDIVIKPMTRAQFESFSTFLIKLKGLYGTFELSPDPNGRVVRGSASSTPGTPTINGAQSTNSNSIDITGAPSSATGYLLSGDYIQIGTQLLKVLDDVNTDGSGDATGINIFPQIRTALSGGETIITSNAVGVFRLADNDTNWNINTASIYGIRFSAMESIS